MLPAYEDITRRLGEPLWYDRHGVPRYDPFRPDMCGVYARYAALLEIECQGCGRRFKVAVDYCNYEFWGGELRRPRLPSAEDEGDFCYGDDPPPHDYPGGGLCAGSTMSSITRRILEFWVRDRFDWERRPEYEFVY
ncbi:MAG: hypothetical protein ACPLRW_05645 [Moorellales bacterium]